MVRVKQRYLLGEVHIEEAKTSTTDEMTDHLPHQQFA
jgi:hypothetical protein